MISGDIERLRHLERELTEDERRFPPRRPLDAAALLLIDRSGSVPKVLVGKRGKRHAFMPDMYVFPGGRRDATDWRVPLAAPLLPEVEARLIRNTPARFRTATARALAVTAAREMMEEASVSLTPPGLTVPLMPDVSRFRFLARAITPPGRSRRFDTRFFTCFTDEIGADPASARDSDELHDLTWLPVNAPDQVALPRITQVILADLAEALDEDGTLPYERPVPFYFYRRGQFARALI